MKEWCHFWHTHTFSVEKWVNDLSSNYIIFKCVPNESSTVQYKFQLHPINPNQKNLVSILSFYLMVHCGFNHWLGWVSSDTKWPPWKGPELLALIETTWPLHLRMHNPPLLTAKINFYIGVWWAPLQVDLDFSSFALKENVKYKPPIHEKRPIIF